MAAGCGGGWAGFGFAVCYPAHGYVDTPGVVCSRLIMPSACIQHLVWYGGGSGWWW